MKRIIILILSFIVVNHHAFSQVQVQNSGVNARLSRVHFVDKNTGWATGYDENDESVILKTTDGGKNWNSQTFDIEFRGGLLFFIDYETGWIFNGNSIARTLDGEENWATTEINSYEDIIEWHFQFVDHSFGWASISTLNGGHSSIFKTSDGGATWQTKYDTLSVLFNPFSMNRIHSQSFISPDTGWVMLCFQILKTTDGGETWIHQEQNLPALKDTSKVGHFSEILFVNSRTGWLRRDDEILRTTDGGSSWSSVDFKYPYWYDVFHFMDDQIGIADGDSLFLTQNGGESWEYIFHKDSTRIWDVCIVDKENIWAVGANGLIVKFSIGDISSVDNPKEKIGLPNNFELHQNYPNPFNPSTIIRYSLPQAGQVSLEIYNLLGQKLETLLDEYQTAGEHQLQWLPEGLPSGIYFYRIAIHSDRLQVGNYSETKTLILQK